MTQTQRSTRAARLTDEQIAAEEKLLTADASVGHEVPPGRPCGAQGRYQERRVRGACGKRYRREEAGKLACR